MIIIILITILLFFLEALLDTFDFIGRKMAAKPLQVVTFLAYFAASIFVQNQSISNQLFIDHGWLILYYILARAALFDLFFNLLNRFNPFYIGNTGIIDISRRLFNKWTRGFYVLIEKPLSLFLAIICLDKFIN